MEIRDLSDFKEAIDKYGFDNFWQKFMMSYLAVKRPDLQKKSSEIIIDTENDIFSFDNIGELYEIALEHTNQISKKEFGQYYTPKDVCKFMASKVIALRKNDENLADVCCGTGNLIIEVLSLLPRKQAELVLRDKKLYLYDLDKNALRLAIMKICILFVPKNDAILYSDIKNYIKSFVGNFLDEKVELSNNTIVISNPPYGKMPKEINVWSDSKTRKTNEMYAVFIEKIAKQADKSVIITPQSFLGGSKFKSLRKVLSAFGGSVYSFDNIPCPIFCGRKKGIFNTNTSNSVRAAITIVDKSEEGFRVSPMIRFKAEEREKMFTLLDKLLGEVRYFDDSEWTKVPKSLETLVGELKSAKQTVSDLITNQENDYKITVPSTPRYFITGSKRELGRSSKIELYAKDEESFEKLYLMINSTFSYLWWRIYDGGITLTKQTLMTMPIPNLSVEKIADLVNEGIEMEEKYIVNKLNAGKNNENIKFPENYRKRINFAVLSSLDFTDKADNLFSIHSNNLAGVAPLWV
jgi:type I restriction-modification system DNA methylase subunit